MMQTREQFPWPEVAPPFMQCIKAVRLQHNLHTSACAWCLGVLLTDMHSYIGALIRSHVLTIANFFAGMICGLPIIQF